MLVLLLTAATPAAAEESPEASACRVVVGTGPASGAPTPGGTCAVKGRGATQPAPALAPTSTVNVSVSCGGACGVAEHAASSPAEAASWPAWAIAHLEAEDTMRRQDHYVRGLLTIGAGLLAAYLGVMAARLAFRSGHQADNESGLHFTSHWGGFGGSTGGWQVTPAFVSLLGALVLALAAAVIVGCMLQAARPEAAAEPALPHPPAANAAASERK